MGEGVLDNPIWWSLVEGAHQALATRHGRAARYPADLTPLCGLEEPSAEALADLAHIVTPGEHVGVPWTRPDLDLGADWERAFALELVQMVCLQDWPETEHGFEELSTADGDEMLALAERTEPGPFSRRSVELGRFLGLREGGRLAAMAGERFAPPGYVEVSAVCTHPDARGRGLAERLVREITAGVQARGRTAFLHVAPASPSGSSATALYERLGYRERRRVHLPILRRTGAPT